MLNFTKKPSSAALAFMVAGSFWFVVGTLYGLASAIHLVAPEFFNNIGVARVRPHAARPRQHGDLRLRGEHARSARRCTMCPRCCGRGCGRSGWAGSASPSGTSRSLSGPSTFLTGITQGREYAEYIWIFDVCIVLALLALDRQPGDDRRAPAREQPLRVGLVRLRHAALDGAGSIRSATSCGIPPPARCPGIMDSIFLWFYGHNLVGLLMTPLALARGLFRLPAGGEDAALFAHALAGRLLHAGGHLHAHRRPPSPADADPQLAEDDLGRGLDRHDRAGADRAGQPVDDRRAAGRRCCGTIRAAGSSSPARIWYLITCIQGPLQSLPSVQRITHLTNWTIGHAHIAVLGFAGFIALGAMWHVLPLITGRELYSRRLVFLQFHLAMFGLVGFFVVLTTAGLIQGSAWLNGETVYKVLPQIAPYMVLRALLGVAIISAALIGFYNVIMTMVCGHCCLR